MLEPPALAENEILGALRAGYGLETRALTFLPLGQDDAAWVYRVTLPERDYFLKLRRNGLNLASLAVPRYLRDQGVTQVVAPLPNLSGALYHAFDSYRLILYPFIDDAQPLPSGRADAQWRRFGAALRQMHDLALSPELTFLLRRETFEPPANALAARLDNLISVTGFADPLQRELAAFWRHRQSEIRGCVARAADYGRRLAARPAPALCVCHADPHWDNVLVDAHEQLWLVDWDDALLAPRERDLMFVIGGISADWATARDTGLFLEGYGPVEVDPLALAYYRADWAVQDLASYAERVLLAPALGEATRREALTIFKGLFAAGEIVEKALGSVTL